MDRKLAEKLTAAALEVTGAIFDDPELERQAKALSKKVIEQVSSSKTLIK